MLEMGAIGISTVLSAQQPPLPQPTPNAADLDSVLSAAGRYLEQYERDVTAVIAQEVVSRRITGLFTVEYAEQAALKLWLPVAMVERYVFPGGMVMDGRAAYSNFRMFRVETTAIIVK
jgi:hypothetical protein